MKTNRFIRENFSDFARITIANEKGEIWYEGDVANFPRVTTIGTEIVSVTLGGSFDFIIVIKEAD